MNNDPTKLKMYIFVKQSIPSHKVLGVAHGVLMAHLKFNEFKVEGSVYEDWLKNSFRKVVCEVTDVEFEALKWENDYVIVTESALDNQQIALVFKPRYEWPKIFKSFPLLKV